MKILLVLVCLFAAAVAGSRSAAAASDLKLAPDLTFTDDFSSNFPITGTELKDGEIANDRPSLIFFGTANCWNTNREVERVVELYPGTADWFISSWWISTPYLLNSGRWLPPTLTDTFRLLPVQFPRRARL